MKNYLDKDLSVNIFISQICPVINFELKIGEIYSALSLKDNEPIAIKIEKMDAKNPMLREEASVLKKLQGKYILDDFDTKGKSIVLDCPYVCRFVAFGRVKEENFIYLVMELLGDNFATLRRMQPTGRFSIKTSAKLGRHSSIRALN